MSASPDRSRQSPPSARSVAPIRIAIIEDQRDIRQGLASLIDSTDGYRCTGCYPSMEDALARFGRELPDVAFIDIGLPGMSGIEGTRLLKERYPTVLLLILTVYDDDDRIFEALCAGACGYLLKKTPSARLLESLREAMNGGAPMSPEVARRVVNLFQRFRPPQHVDYHLTPHEVRLVNCRTRKARSCTATPPQPQSSLRRLTTNSPCAQRVACASPPTACTSRGATRNRRFVMDNAV